MSYDRDTFKIHYNRIRRNYFQSSIVSKGTNFKLNKISVYSIGFVQSTINSSYFPKHNLEYGNSIILPNSCNIYNNYDINPVPIHFEIKTENGLTIHSGLMDNSYAI
jgi:hypothetical protein